MPVPGGERTPWPRIALLVLAGGCLLAVAVRVAIYDPTQQRVVGDQAAYVYDALSLQGGDLSFDEEDHERWVELGWTSQANGLFVQHREDGWAFAKPLGYSVALAPFLWGFGAAGISYLGALLVLAYAGCWYAAARLRWTAPTALAVAAAATVASHAWFSGFVAHADLFVAVLVGVVTVGCLRAALLRQPAWLLAAAAAYGLLLTEKVPALLALVPFVVVAAWRAPSRARLGALGVAVLVGALSVVPYLYYSDGASWSAYGGDRYYAPGRTPWSGGTVEELRAMSTDEIITVDYALEQVAHPTADIGPAALSYGVGQHTGVLTFLPVVPALLVATAAAVVLRRRRGDAVPRAEDETTVPLDPPLAWAAAASLLLYAAFNIVLFPHNHYGGQQSIGSRYFLQFSVVAAAIPVAVGLSARAARWCAAFAAVWAVAVLGPHLRRPEAAFHDLWRTSAIQRLLPFDGTQVFQEQWIPPDERDGEGPQP